MRKANFFIVGAPKCGTTSLASYLHDHEDVFFSDPKEPNYFNKDFSKIYRKNFSGKVIATDEDYTYQFFKDVSTKHKSIGEGSPWYFSSDVAADNIKNYNSKAKIIIMLRNPIDMAPAIHSEELFWSMENVTDFRKSWNLQVERQNGGSIPPNCLEPKTIQYKNACMLGLHMKRWLTVFPHAQVMPIIFDDFASDTLCVYKAVLDFLEIPYDDRIHFPKKNRRKGARLAVFNRLAGKGSVLSVLSDRAKYVLGIRSFGIKPLISKYNIKSKKRERFSPEFFQELQEYFFEDIQILEKLIGKNLSHWHGNGS